MLGVGTGPPNVLDMLKPTSSARNRKMSGAPCGAVRGFGMSGVDSDTVRPIVPANGSGSSGRTERDGSARPGTADNKARRLPAVHARNRDLPVTWFSSSALGLGLPHPDLSEIGDQRQRGGPAARIGEA